MKTKSKILVRKNANKTVLVYEGEQYELQTVKQPPPMRESIMLGGPLEPDLSQVPADYLLAELIRRGYRALHIPEEKPQPKKGKK